MHPILYKIPVPEFLRGILPDELIVASYGTLIVLGIISGYFYMKSAAKKELNLHHDTIMNIIIVMVIASVIGGKVFFYLENPGRYIEDPSRMFKNFGSGFVFYGSLIFAVSSLVYYFRTLKINVLKMFDIVTIFLCILHAFGRLGCFMAGCCHGVPHDGIFSVVFTDPMCLAKPLNTPLHPTQLYSIFMIITILSILLWVKRNKKFDGQLSMLYLMLYSVGRSIIEVFRGDEARGYIIDGYITHSQMISFFVISFALFVYYRLSKKSTPPTNNL